MNKILLLLLLSFNCYSQDIAENFTVKKNIITWSKVYEFKDDPIPFLKQNLALKFDEKNSGAAQDLNLRCKSISIYARENFKFNFLIEIKDGKYKVTASNFVFSNSFNINLSGISSNETPSTIEKYELRNKDNTIRTNSQSKTNINCLNDYLSELFQIKPTKEW